MSQRAPSDALARSKILRRLALGPATGRELSTELRLPAGVRDRAIDDLVAGGLVTTRGEAFGYRSLTTETYRLAPDPAPVPAE